MSISKKQFGRMPDGMLVDIFTLEDMQIRQYINFR